MEVDGDDEQCCRTSASPRRSREPEHDTKLAPFFRVGDDRRMERRERRSDCKDVALQLFLEAHRRRLGVRALTLSDLQGKMVAGAGDIPREVARTSIEIDEARGGIADGDGVATWRLRAGGEWLVLASWGGRLSYDVGSGVRRILAQ